MNEIAIVTEVAVNNNALLIEGLRAAADLLESRPDFPALGQNSIGLYLYNAEKFKEAAQHMGSFQKVVDDSYYTLKVPLNKDFHIYVRTARETICKKVTRWECPDEGLLKMMEGDVDKTTGEEVII